MLALFVRAPIKPSTEKRHCFLEGAVMQARRHQPATVLLSACLLLLVQCSKNQAPGPSVGPGNEVATSCTPPSSFMLPVELVPQEQDNWCWAASAEMVMKRFGKDPAQCVQANERFSQSSCCSKTQGPGKVCNQTSWPHFEAYSLNAQRTCKSALSWQNLKTQVFCKKTPVAFSWLWTADGASKADCDKGHGHMMVVRGYEEAAGKLLLYVNDPEPNADRRQPNPMTYAEYAGSSQDHSHWDDYYDVAIVGGSQ
jgi:Peptidase_C39 like family